MSGRTRITLPDGKAIYQPSQDASDRLQAWFQDRLQAFHGHAPRPTCGCQHAGRPLDLVIRRLASGRLILARMPNEGSLHREICDFHSPDADRSGRAGYVRGVLTETDDGGYVVRLELGLSIRGTDPQPVPETPPSGRPGSGTQRVMTALGLLHALWETARLNSWHPGFGGKRKPGVVAWRLAQAADQFRAVRTELESVFMAIAPDRWGSDARLQQLVRESAPKRRRLVLVAEVTSIKADPYGRMNIHLAGGRAARLFLSAARAQADTLLRQHPYAARLLETETNERAERVVGLFIVEAEAGEWRDRPIVKAALLTGGLMETNADFIPVASDLERQVADRLVAEERSFIKPLRYDADTELVLPDFVLTDTVAVRGTPMEVFGRADEDYRARQAAKTAYYRDVYGTYGWWQWIAAGPERTPMPLFPGARVDHGRPNTHSTAA